MSIFGLPNTRTLGPAMGYLSVTQILIKDFNVNILFQKTHRTKQDTQDIGLKTGRPGKTGRLCEAPALPKPKQQRQRSTMVFA